jgi:hypothetical protein
MSIVFPLIFPGQEYQNSWEDNDPTVSSEIDEEVRSHLNKRKLPVRGLTIRDKDNRNVLTFDLKDILLLLGQKGLTSTWSLTGLEVVDGDSAEELHGLSDSGQVVSGERLKELVNKISQTIDGEFSASLGDYLEPWMLIRAVDSSGFDVITADRNVYRKIKSRFSDVVELVNVDGF